MERKCAIRIGLYTALTLAVVLSGCGGPALTSLWRDRDVTVDGFIDDNAGARGEWAGGMTVLEDHNASIGVFNDEEFLYVSLIVKDPRVSAQLITRGVTLWFDPEGGKDETFGIQFPLGMEDPMAMRGLMGGGPRIGRGGPGGAERPEGDGTGPGSAGPDPETMRELLETAIASSTELIILGPGEDDRRLREIGQAQAKEIDVAIGMSGGALVYELKVPLNETAEHPYAVGTEPGKVVGVGLRAGEFNLADMRKKMGGGRGMGPGGGPGGIGMGGRGGGGGMRGRMGGRRPEMPEAIDLWTKVRLASAGSPAVEKSVDDVAVTAVER